MRQLPRHHRSRALRNPERHVVLLDTERQDHLPDATTADRSFVVSPILRPNTLDFISHSPQQTRRLAARLAELLQGGETICLSGKLGAGKTTFVQGLGEGLGIDEPIISPTFTLIREYVSPQGRPPLYHIDFYRLETTQDFQSLGLDEYFYGDGICAVEWPERAPSLLPEERLWIDMFFVDDMKRELLIRAEGQRYEELLAAFRKRTFGV